MPDRPQEPGLITTLNDYGRRLRDVERQVILPDESGDEDLQVSENGSPLGPVNRLDFGTGIAATLIGDKYVRVEASSGVGEFDAIVDATIAATDTTVFPPIFKTSPGEALAYLNSIGLRSVVVLVRNNLPIGSGTLEYVETANWDSPPNVHLVAMRGANGGMSGLGPADFGTTVLWTTGAFRPISPVFSPPNYLVEGFTHWTFSSWTTTYYGLLVLLRTYAEVSGPGGLTPLATNVVCFQSAIRMTGTQAWASTVFEAQETDIAITSQSGAGGSFSLGGTVTIFKDGWLNCNGSGTAFGHTLFLPIEFDIEARRTASKRTASGTINQLNLSLAGGATGRIVSDQCPYAVTTPSGIGQLELLGYFQGVNVTFTGGGIVQRFICDITLNGAGSGGQLLTVGAATALNGYPHFIKANCDEHVDITGPAIIDIGMERGDGRVTLRGTSISGSIVAKSSDISSGALITGVNLDSSSISVAAPGGAASGTGKPFALDAASEQNVFLWHDRASWVTPGTDAGTGNRFLPEGTVPSAPSDATYLTQTAHAGLTNEIAVGVTPGGELGGTWPTPTVDAIHSGSAHSDFVPVAGHIQGHVIEDEAVVLTQRANMNFVGAGVTAADSGGKTVVTIPATATINGHVIEDEGTPLTQRANLNFVGAGVTVTDSAPDTLVTIAGGGHVIQDEGVDLAAEPRLNFVGAGVTVTDNPGVSSIVTIPGGGGSGDTLVAWIGL